MPLIRSASRHRKRIFLMALTAGAPLLVCGFLLGMTRRRLQMPITKSYRPVSQSVFDLRGSLKAGRTSNAGASYPAGCADPRVMETSMTKLAVVIALTMLTGSAAFAQAYDPAIGSGNLTAMPPVVTILPPACETRRMQ